MCFLFCSNAMDLRGAAHKHKFDTGRALLVHLGFELDEKGDVNCESIHIPTEAMNSLRSPKSQVDPDVAPSQTGTEDVPPSPSEADTSPDITKVVPRSQTVAKFVRRPYPEFPPVEDATEAKEVSFLKLLHLFTRVNFSASPTFCSLRPSSRNDS